MCLLMLIPFFGWRKKGRKMRGNDGDEGSCKELDSLLLSLLSVMFSVLLSLLERRERDEVDACFSS